MRCTVLLAPGYKEGALDELGTVAASDSSRAVPAPSVQKHSDILLYWGYSPGMRIPPGGHHILNRPDAQALAADTDARAYLWRLAGLKVVDRRVRVGDYRVCIGPDFQPVSIYRVVKVRTRRGRYRRTLRTASRRRRGMADMILAAQRALHTVRLDYGVVDANLTRRGEPVILGVTPDPSPEGRPGQRLIEGLKRYLSMLQVREYRRAVLGADPEFTVRDLYTGRTVALSRYLPARGRLGLDRALMRGSRVARPIGEIRPHPDDDPEELVAQIHRLLLRLYRRLSHSRYAWIAGNGLAPYSTGGHIHISNIPLTTGLLRALDVYLAILFLLVEHPAKARRRRRRYGGLGDFRRKPWGFEYRTVPSWLVSPDYTRAAFVLAKIVAEHWPRLQLDPFLSPDTQGAFYSCRKSVFHPYWSRLRRDLESLPGYDQFGEALEPLIETVEEGRIWAEGRDFGRQWGFQRRRPRRRRSRRTARSRRRR